MKSRRYDTCRDVVVVCCLGLNCGLLAFYVSKTTSTRTRFSFAPSVRDELRKRFRRFDSCRKGDATLEGKIDAMVRYEYYSLALSLFTCCLQIYGQYARSKSKVTVTAK
jgi:hypothetical protein